MPVAEQALPRDPCAHGLAIHPATRGRDPASSFGRPLGPVDPTPYAGSTRAAPVLEAVLTGSDRDSTRFQRANPLSRYPDYSADPLPRWTPSPHATDGDHVQVLRGSPRPNG